MAFDLVLRFAYKERMTQDNALNDIIEAGRRLDSLHLAPATSGNYSVRVGDEMRITVSGKSKGRLGPEDIMRADIRDGRALEDKTPSAETLLHCLIYRLYPHIQAVLHTHSVPCSVLTRPMKPGERIILADYEMLKAYPGIETHDTAVHLPVFENTQDMSALVAQAEPVLQEMSSRCPAFLIKGHGIYGWGRDMDEALRVIEATEMLLSCEMYARF